MFSTVIFIRLVCCIWVRSFLIWIGMKGKCIIVRIIALFCFGIYRLISRSLFVEA